MKYFTADLHLGDPTLINIVPRPFRSVERMNEVLIANINSRAKNPEDIVYHVGDFIHYGNTKGVEGLRVNGPEYIAQIKPRLVLLSGNHDGNNRLNADCQMVVVHICKNIYASVSHFPSWYEQSRNLPRCPVHLCGHVHGAWKTRWDPAHNVYNINVGVDAWNYQLVSLPQIIKLVEQNLRG